MQMELRKAVAVAAANNLRLKRARSSIGWAARRSMAMKVPRSTTAAPRRARMPGEPQPHAWPRLRARSKQMRPARNDRPPARSNRSARAGGGAGGGGGEEHRCSERLRAARRDQSAGAGRKGAEARAQGEDGEARQIHRPLPSNVAQATEGEQKPAHHQKIDRDDPFDLGDAPR